MPVPVVILWKSVDFTCGITRSLQTSGETLRWNVKAQLEANHQGTITNESHSHPSMPCQAVPMETAATSRDSGNMPIAKGQGLGRGATVLQYSGISKMFPPFSGPLTLARLNNRSRQ